MTETMKWRQDVAEWVAESTHEEELRALFLELEDVLREMGLLRADYKQYRTLHFAEFCADIYRHTTNHG
jgi:hypothetical protein